MQNIFDLASDRSCCKRSATLGPVVHNRRPLCLRHRRRRGDWPASTRSAKFLFLVTGGLGSVKED